MSISDIIILFALCLVFVYAILIVLRKMLNLLMKSVPNLKIFEFSKHNYNLVNGSNENGGPQRDLDCEITLKIIYLFIVRTLLSIDIQISSL